MTTTTTTTTEVRGRAERSGDRRRGGLRLAAGALVGLLAALGTTAAAGIGGRAAAATPTVQVETNDSFGAILASSTGMALYTLDTDHSSQSTCHGACAAAWPALTVPTGTPATAGPGVTGTVGTALQSNGTTQVTDNGLPLYTFVGDTAPGQVTGNNVTGFFVVTSGLSTTTTTLGTTPAPTGTGTGTTPGTPGAPGAPTSPAPALPPASTPGHPGPSTSPSGTLSAGRPSAAGPLAFTGTGAGLRWLLLLALLLSAMGTAVISITTVAAGRARRRLS